MKRFAIIILILVVSLGFSASFFSGFLTDLWWFQTAGFEAAYWTVFEAKAAVFAVSFIFYFLFLYGNLRVALYLTRDLSFQFSKQLPAQLTTQIKKMANLAVTVIAGFLSFLAAQVAVGSWDTILKYFHGVDFSQADPIFGRDIGFYFFQLPFYEGFKGWFLGMIILTMIAVFTVYFFKGAIRMGQGLKQLFSAPVQLHLSFLLGVLAFLGAAHFWFEQYNLLYSEAGVVFGAGYTDEHARLWAYRIVSVSLLALGAVAIYAVVRRAFLVVVSGAGAFVLVYIVVGLIYPSLQQRLVVEPNELEKEKPYLLHNIEYTQKSYGLDQFERQSFQVNNKMTRTDLFRHQEVINNIRLWDWRPLLSTYKQIQEIRPYYKFSDVDIDRYYVDGQYRQLMISVRELAYNQVDAQAQTWVNQRIKYTHGYGVVASPVNAITKEGMPELMIRDIPPVSSTDLSVTQPAIYYGEETNHYIFTGASDEEFDYPLGNKNKTVHYSGKGGVPMGSFWRRLLYTYEYGSLKVLISRYFNENTKIHPYRNIRQRAHKVAPFLSYDLDPYIAIIDGRLKWIIDAYMVGSKYPYAEPFSGEGHNYIRNSVKVVIDAYDGDMKFYIVDSDDPLLQVYASIFPGLFTPKEEIPEEIKKHFRYPIDYFKIQASMYLTYHMNDPEVFYNREDLWRFPSEIHDRSEQVMEPYYTVMPLKGPNPEFLLILPFTPAKKNNMIAWMAAGSDGENYGKVTVYEFSKKELIYGPMQIEARIDQDPKISEVLTLWNQQGSSVIRGNLLVIPVQESLLYVEPLYLQAEQSKMPELKRVIVAYNNVIAMEDTLEKALYSVFSANGGDYSEQTSFTKETPLAELISEAGRIFERGEEAMRNGNWQEYGKKQVELKNILRQMKKTVK